MKITLTPAQFDTFAVLQQNALAAEARLAQAQKVLRGFFDALVPGAGAIGATYGSEPNTLELLFSNGDGR